MRVIHSTFGLWVLVGLLMPFGLGYLIDGTLAGALTAALWGGPVRIFALHHVTWSINSICHFFGTRRFEVEDHSTNVFWLARSRSARAGTTTTTRSRGLRCTGYAGGRSTRPRG